VNKKEKVDVWAAGGVVYRKGNNKKGLFEILLVHRPSYDDWSFPKGKQDPGETLKETALREVCEETGFYCQTKGRVGLVRYEVGKGRLKEIHYWAMKVESGEFKANNEVDKICWVKPKKAQKILTWSEDRDLLENFLKWKSNR
tara:strand:- start:586 stop:1014 length:429 start_codon:yes stop_codon:yes gene_type:complete